MAVRANVDKLMQSLVLVLGRLVQLQLASLSLIDFCEADVSCGHKRQLSSLRTPVELAFYAASGNTGLQVRSATSIRGGLDSMSQDQAVGREFLSSLLLRGETDSGSACSFPDLSGKVALQRDSRISV